MDVVVFVSGMMNFMCAVSASSIFPLCNDVVLNNLTELVSNYQLSTLRRPLMGKLLR